MATAGRTVLFSSLTVAAALAVLLVFPQRFLYSMGLGGSMVALMAAAISLTVLPAVLALLGDRVNSLAPKFLQRRAERDAPARRGGLLVPPLAARDAAARPDRGRQRRAPDRARDPVPGDQVHLGRRPDPARGASARQVDDVAARRLPAVPRRADPGLRGRRQATSATPRSQSERERARGRRRGQPAATARGRHARDRGDLGRTAALRRASHDPVGASAASTGSAAAPSCWSPAPPRDFIDFQESLDDHLPLALAIIVARDPHRALPDDRVGGAADQAAADERAQPERGLRDPRPDLPGRPLRGPARLHEPGRARADDADLLLSRSPSGSPPTTGSSCSRGSRRRATAARATRESVAIGLERTGRIVTAAALLFAIAIGAFATSQIIFIKQNGVGTALAVLIDATIIRALLVPSLMELLGHWNWWAPKPLRRLHYRFGL